MADDLGQTLVALAEEDLALREQLAASGELFSVGYHPRMQAVHERNAERLLAIIERTGWPTSAKVGEPAARAAWLIAQHAIGRPAFQRRCAAALDEAVASGEAPGWQAAMLTDRIRVFEGRPQLYGTQFRWDEHGELSPGAIEEAETVDERRRSLGLPSLAQRKAELTAEAEREGQRPPIDWRSRQAEFERWAKDAGWR